MKSTDELYVRFNVWHLRQRHEQIGYWTIRNFPSRIENTANNTHIILFRNNYSLPN